MTQPHFPTHLLQFSVRDYELDLQGIVNNSVYFNYLEHARHCFLDEKGVNFAQLFEDGIAAMVIKSELEYKSSLKSGDHFEVETFIEKQGRFKVIFHQNIRRVGEENLVLKAKITAACIDIHTKKPVEVDW